MKECKQYEKLLPGYLHGELYENEYYALRAHLEQCASCRNELEALSIAFDLAGKVMAAVPTPTRMTGWRRLPKNKINLRTNAFARIWFSPQFKAALATIVISVGLFFISGLFVVFTVLPKEEMAFCAPPPVQRPRMALNKVSAPSNFDQQSSPKLRKKVVARSPAAEMDYETEDLYGVMPEVVGVRGGVGAAAEDESRSSGFPLSEERPKMVLKKPRVKKSSRPKPSSRIVAKVKTASMPEIQVPDLAGAGHGLMGRTEILDLPEIETVSMFGSAVSVEPEPDSVQGAKQDRYADPFAVEPQDSVEERAESMDDLFGGDIMVLADSRDKDDGMNDLFGEGADFGDVSELAMAGQSFSAAALSEPTETPAEVRHTWKADFKDELSVQPRERKPAVYNPYVMAAENAFSTFAIDVDRASYGLARQHLLDGALPDTEAVRTEEFVNSFDYDYRPPAGKHTFAVHTAMAPSPFRSRMEVLKVGIKGRRIGRDDHRKAILTLVIDTSGSMSTPERLGLVKQSLNLLLDQLNPEDEVAIVQFGGDAHLVLEHTPVSEKDAVLSAINALQPGGPTQFDKGLELGYRMATDGFKAGDSNRIIIMSDGVANLGELDPDSILEQVANYRTRGIYLSVLGFGAGTYDDELLERLANRGDGMYAYVDTMDEARQLFVDRLASTLHVIASDVKIQIEFNPDRVLRYRQMGYENRQLTQEQFRDDTVDAGEVGSGQAVTALYEVELKPIESERDSIATVYVRYRRADNGVIEEISNRVMDAHRTARFEDADARFQLAVCVAEFAERLRRSPYAEGTQMSDVLGRLQPVLLTLDLDDQVHELQQLISIAAGLEK